MTVDDKKIPNLLIAGVNRSGTTSLYSYFARHHDVCCSSIKETCYFSAYRYGVDAEPFEQYLQYFSHCEKQKYIMEATPGYFVGGKLVAEAIKDRLGVNVKIILIFREPIDRFISFYKHKISMLELDRCLNINDYLQQCISLHDNEIIKQENDAYWGLAGGFYSDHLEAWFNTFGNSLKITFFDDLIDNPSIFMKNLCEWLGIESAIYNIESFPAENRSVDYKFKELHRAALLINNKFEKFWRTNGKLKRMLRVAYYVMNGRRHKKKISRDTFGHLQLLYRPYNNRLAKILIKRGHTKLPQWLANDQ